MDFIILHHIPVVIRLYGKQFTPHFGKNKILSEPCEWWQLLPNKTKGKIRKKGGKLRVNKSSTSKNSESKKKGQITEVLHHLSKYIWEGTK